MTNTMQNLHLQRTERKILWTKDPRCSRCSGSGENASLVSKAFHSVSSRFVNGPSFPSAVANMEFGNAGYGGLGLL